MNRKNGPSSLGLGVLVAENQADFLHVTREPGNPRHCQYICIFWQRRRMESEVREV